MKNIFKISIVVFLVIIAGVIVIASDIIVKQGDLTINKLTANNIGIGISNSNTGLHVVKDDGLSASPSTEHWFALFGRDSATNAIALGYRVNTAGTVVEGAVIRTASNYPLYLGTSGSQQALTILNNGNVGIGNKNPGAKLHVIGTVRFASVGSGVVGAKDYVCVDSTGTLSRSDTPCA